MKHALRTHRLNFVPFAIAILGFMPGRGTAQTFPFYPAFGHVGTPPVMQRTVKESVDFNADGRIDLRFVEDVGAHGSLGKRQHVDPAPGVTLVGSGFRKFAGTHGPSKITETLDAQPGLVVDPKAPPQPDPAYVRRLWLRVYDQVTADGGEPGLGAATTQFYIGAIFPAPDGLHAGWVHFVKDAAGKWSRDASAWNPVPDAPLAVGAAPDPGPVADIEFHAEYVTALAPVSFATGEVTLGRRAWTNHADHTHGLVLDVRGNTEWTWRTRSSGETNVAVAVPVRLPLPALPPDPNAAWNPVDGGLVLYRATFDAQGLGQFSGPLADGAAVFAVFNSGTSAGWVRVEPDGADFQVAHVATAVGATEVNLNPEYTSSTTNLDLDNDGLVDFVLEHDVFRYFDDNADYFELEPLAGGGISNFPDFLPPDATVKLGPDTAFATNRITYFSTFINGLHQITHNGLVDPVGVLGLRFAAADGIHYGWARLSHTDTNQPPVIEASVYNPWPGEGLVSGAPAPDTLRAGRAVGGGVRITWPPLLPVGLERYEITGARQWAPVTPTGAGEFAPAAHTDSALFRLVAKP